MLGGIRHSYFSLRWSYNHQDSFLDSSSNVTSSLQYTYEGLLASGFIDISVTLIKKFPYHHLAKHEYYNIVI